MISSRAQHVGLEGPYIPTKTPSRLKGRTENVIHAGSKTAGPKGKNVAPRTPFRPEPNRLLKNVLATQGKAAASSKQNRPLLDKTPFPNRAENYEAPPGGFVKVPKLVFLETATQEATPEMQRPSSTRKHSRFRRSESQKFETPVNSGRHWDVGDISLGSPEVQTQDTILEDNDLDEIEYAAPNTLDIAYQPPVDFDLPDYKLFGELFRKQVFSAPVCDVDPPELHLPSIEIEDQAWNLLVLPELDDDDPFRLPQAATKVIEVTTVSKFPRARPLSALPSSVSLRANIQARMRPATAAANVNAKAPARVPPTAQLVSRRPMTLTSNVAARLPAAASKTASNMKPTMAGGKAVPYGRTKAPCKTTSTRSLQPSKSRTLQPLETESILFRDVSLELQDDFMFDV